MAAPIVTDHTQGAWTDHVLLSGKEGRQWVAEYSAVQKLEQVCQNALVAFRRHKDGWPLLHKVGDVRKKFGPELSPSVVAVLDRWIHGVEGYGHYVAGDFDAAEGSMEQAREDVVTALTDSWCVLPLANHCHEFTMHRARIERNRGRWQEMWAHIESARDMVEGRAPLCQLHDGRTVGFDDLCRYYRALDLPAEERAAVEPYFEVETRKQSFEDFVEKMLATVSPAALQAAV